MNNELLGVGVLTMIIFWLGMVILWPFFVIWALNTLFGFAIAFTFKTWAAALVLCMTVRATASTSSSK